MRAAIRVAGLIVFLAAGTTWAGAPAMFVVHFEAGPAWDESAAPADQSGFKEHSANLNRLRKEGLITFGARYGEFGMIFIKAESLAAVKSIVAADPGVRSGIFTFRIDALNVFYPWQP